MHELIYVTNFVQLPDYARERMRRWIVNPASAGATTYMPRLSAITDIPKPRTSASEPTSAKVMMDKVDNMGVMNNLTASRNIGFSRSASAIAGENR